MCCSLLGMVLILELDTSTDKRVKHKKNIVEVLFMWRGGVCVCNDLERLFVGRKYILTLLANV